jgi:HNH endonuclease
MGHLRRLKVHGDVSAEIPLRERSDNSGPCTVETCGKPARKKKLCDLHYYRVKYHGDPFANEKIHMSRHLEKNGYVRVYVSGEGLRAEHRLVMENILGRKLYPHESVHHKNGIRDDNRPENLELWASLSQPYGQRVSDLVEYAEKILSIYGDSYGKTRDNHTNSSPIEKAE